ncbi:MAG: hypothetical protein V2A74_10065, partial [bacterium]
MRSKKIRIAIGAVVLVAVVAFFVLYSNLNRIARTAIIKTMEFVLQVDVTLDEVKVSPTQGEVVLRNLVIGNPQGYKTDHAIRFGLIHAKADIASFWGETPTVNLVEFGEAEITMEANGLGSNLQDLLNNASRLASKQEKGEAEKPGKSLKIEKVVLNENTVRVALPLSGGQTLSVHLPDTEINNLGGENKRLSPAQALELFFAALLQKIRIFGTGILPADLLQGIGTSLEGLSTNVKDAFGNLATGLQGAVEGATTEVSGALNEAGDKAK